MYSIKDISLCNIDDVKKFVESVPGIKKVDIDILKNGVVLIDDNNIIGTLAYEDFYKCGLVRYFIFKKSIEEEYIFKLFNSLEEKTISNHIFNLYCIANNKEIFDLFNEMGFIEVNKEKFFINETNVSKIENEKGIVMCKTININ